MKDFWRVRLFIAGAVALCALALPGIYTRHRQAVEQAEKIDALKAEIRQLSVTADIAYGNQQVAQMLADRPAMSEYRTRAGETHRVTENDWIWQWAAAHYGQMVNGERIAWDRSEPDKYPQFSAEHQIPRPGSVGLIRIRDYTQSQEGETRSATFDELWSSCVFELFNIQNAKGFLNIYDQAVYHNLSREEWVRRNTRLEYQTSLKVADFCRKVWMPWAQQNNYNFKESEWCLDLPQDFERWIQKYRNAAGHPYLRFYEDYYDNEIIPYRQAEKDYQEELKEWERLYGPKP